MPDLQDALLYFNTDKPQWYGWIDTAYDGYYIYPSAGGTISGTILVYGYGE